MRAKLTTALAFLAVIVLASVGTATAGALINGKDIKKGSIPLSAINKSAVKSLQGNAGPAGPGGPAGPAGAPAIKYWADVDENGTIVHQSGGLSASRVTNSGQTAKTRITFPADVSGCFWSATNADSVNILAANDVVIPRFVTVGRSSIGGNTLEVAVVQTNGTNLVFDAFDIGVVC